MENKEKEKKEENIQSLPFVWTRCNGKEFYYDLISKKEELKKKENNGK